MADKQSRIIGGEFAIPHELISKDNTGLRLEANKYYYSSGRCALFAVLNDIEHTLGEIGGGTSPRFFMRLNY